MARKRKKVAEPTFSQKLTTTVDALLSAEHITPMQVYEIMLMGHRAYKQGVGVPESTVLEAIITAFKQHDRHYLNPYQFPTLRGEPWDSRPTESDFDTLRSYA